MKISISTLLTLVYCTSAFAQSSVVVDNYKEKNPTQKKRTGKVASSESYPDIFVSLPGKIDTNQEENKPNSQKDCACDKKYLDDKDTLPLTPQVKALFLAAKDLDEPTFTKILPSIENINQYLSEGQTLLSALLHPKSPNSNNQRDTPVYWDMKPEQSAALIAEHQSTLPKRTRMLALTLKQGVNPNESTFTARKTPLQLALLFGSTEIVDLLLKAGADPNKPGELFERASPIEKILDSEYTIRMSYLPDLVTSAERSKMLIAMIKAGAKRPYSYADDEVKTIYEEDAKKKGINNHLSTAADLFLWPPLIEMTQGSEVLDIFRQMGTTPMSPSNEENLFSRAAWAGSVDAVIWLKTQIPRYYDREEYNQTSTHIDAWNEAAYWALLQPDSNVRQQLFELLTDENTDWRRIPSRQTNIEKHYLTRSSKIEYSQKQAYGDNLLSYVVQTGELRLLSRAIQLGALSPKSNLSAESAPKNKIETSSTTLKRETTTVDALDENMPQRYSEIQAISKPSVDALIESILTQKETQFDILFNAGVWRDITYRSGQRNVSPLEVAANPLLATDYDAKGFDKETPQASAFLKRSLEKMLNKLTPEQLGEFNTAKVSPIKNILSLSMQRSTIDRINMLIQAGFTLDRLSLNEVADAILADAPDLALKILKAGAVRNISPEGDGILANSIVNAHSKGYTELRDQLFLLRGKSNIPNKAESNATAYLISSGEIGVVKELHQLGWPLDIKANQAALNMWDIEDFNYFQTQNKVALQDLCLEPKSLAYGLLSANEKTWQAFIQYGIAKLPACVTQDIDEDNDDQISDKKSISTKLSPLTYAAAILLHQPYIQLGERKQIIPQRISQLRQHGMKAADFDNSILKKSYMAASASSAMQPIIEVLEGPTNPFAFLQTNYILSKEDISKWVGSYSPAERQMEVAQGFRLKADGSFFWARSYGAVDERITGRWGVKGQNIYLISNPTIPFNWIKLLNYTQYEKGPETGQRIYINLVNEKMQAIDGLTGEIELSGYTYSPVQFNNIEPIKLAPTQQAMTLGIWFPQMGTPFAYEIQLPKVDRLKTINLQLQIPNSMPSMVFNKILPIKENDLLLDGRLFKKAVK